MATNPRAADFAPGMAARAAANRALTDCLRRKRPLDAAIDDAVTRLPVRDGGFARAIANETLRRFGQLDDIVRRFVPRHPPPHRAGPTLEILLAASCELLFLGVAPHAAVDGANRLAADDPKAVHFKPLINASLRSIAREGAGLVQGQDESRLNTPDWLWSRWLESYGEEVTRAIARVHVQTPPLDVVLRSRFETVVHTGATPLPGGVLRMAHGGRVESLPGFSEGRFWVQDFAATLPARLFGDVAGRRIIDLCAAPGGKTAQLCESGARVVAVERDECRMARLQQNLVRLRLDAELILADVRDYRPKAPADCVLLDAPCSGTGTVRRHPELPWIKSAGDVAACADATAESLDAAASMVNSGGLLVFAVCSLEAEEGPEQVTHFLRRHAEFRRVPIAAGEALELPQCVDANGDLRTLPCHLAERGGMDGFYAARFVRL